MATLYKNRNIWYITVSNGNNRLNYLPLIYRHLSNKSESPYEVHGNNMSVYPSRINR